MYDFLDSIQNTTPVHEIGTTSNWRHCNVKLKSNVGREQQHLLYHHKKRLLFAKRVPIVYKN